MKDRADIDRVLDHWFGDGPSRMPDRVLDVVADRIAHQRQRPSWRHLTLRGIHMNGSLRIAAAVAAVIVIGLVGLRLLGTGGPSVGAPGGSSTTPSSASPASSSPAPSPSSSLAAGVVGACDLVTADELASALGLSSTVTPDPNINGNNGDVNYCIYRSAGTEVLGASYRKSGGGPVFDAWKSNAGVQAVSGLGDAALWDPTQKTLFILKGASVYSIDGGSTPLDRLKAVGAIAVGRM